MKVAEQSASVAAALISKSRQAGENDLTLTQPMMAGPSQGRKDWDEPVCRDRSGERLYYRMICRVEA